MTKNKTDKKLLAEGIKILVLAIFTLFMGPILLSAAFANPDKPLYLPLLIVGCLVSASAIFLGFKGIRTIMKSMFGDKK
ncbi:DUF6095 family protein [Gaetbulibacter aestuarii]|uniref:DUF6095 family protein n=1 Tax=Gaetbulibacter aestuarii TaxID=1502358 RepID=A0ABW7N1H8_9FLAO